MNIYEILEAKKNNKSLTKQQIDYFVEAYLNGEIKDYQVSALLMAICINGFDTDETFYLTDSIVRSGQTIDLSSIDGIKVDKHSTGGVGDSVTLVLGPLLASCGLKFAKMSGRGLGHTGGTLDKLEAIEGFNINLEIDEFLKNVRDINIAICGQTADIAPADKLLYALRDATATVDNLGLIASSIMSKKIAVSSDVIVIDVKMGSGAFMKTIEDAKKLAKLLVEISNRFNKRTSAVISNMDEPLGYAVGNSIEVLEAIDTLQGKGPKDLEELVLKIGSKMLISSEICKNEEEAMKLLRDKLISGAYEKFEEMVIAQGGTKSSLDRDKFKLSSIKKEVIADSEGYVTKIDALEVGDIARTLGAGRLRKEDEIDLGAGILLNKKIGDEVKNGDLLATIYTEREEVVEDALKRLKSSYKISNIKEDYKLILEVVD